MSAVIAFAAATGLLAAGCQPGGNERWATTENTNVPIDFDKVNQAYKDAEGPEDFERRVNEIYEGDEIVSVAVQDSDAKTQLVTGFFDKNANGQVEEPEKIFTIRRDIVGEGAQVQTSGYGPYMGYHSPMLSIASGMLMGSMLSSAFRPNYVPIYTQPYTTSPSRVSSLSSARSSYRAQNPTRFERAKASQTTGKSYNRSGTSGRTGFGRSGGSRFGVAGRRNGRRAERLTS